MTFPVYVYVHDTYVGTLILYMVLVPAVLFSAEGVPVKL